MRMNVFILTLLAAAVAVKGNSPEATAEVTVKTTTLETQQTTHKASNPRFFQNLTPQSTGLTGMTCVVERYTHGNKGEGWLVTYTYDDGTNVWVRKVNKGPATYLEQNWLNSGASK